MATKEVRVIWVAGNLHERKALMANIRSQLGDHQEYVYGDTDRYDHVEQQILASDCFSPKRLVILTSLPQPVTTRATMLTHLKKLLENVPADCLVAFYGIDPNEEKAISAHVDKVGRMFVYNATGSMQEVEGVVRDVFRESGKEIDASCVSGVARSLDSDDGRTFELDTARLAAERLLSYVGARAKVTPEDVFKCCPPSGQSTEWMLFDALDDRDFDKAVTIRSQLLARNANGRENELLWGVLGVAMWRYRLMAMVKEMQSFGATESDIIAACTAFQKTEQEGQRLKMKLTAIKPAYGDYKVRELVGGNLVASPLEKYTRKRLLQIMDTLDRMSEFCRSCDVDSQWGLLLDILLLVACEKADERTISRLWGSFHTE